MVPCSSTTTSNIKLQSHGALSAQCQNNYQSRLQQHAYPARPPPTHAVCMVHIQINHLGLMGYVGGLKILNWWLWMVVVPNYVEVPHQKMTFSILSFIFLHQSLYKYWYTMYYVQHSLKL